MINLSINSYFYILNSQSNKKYNWNESRKNKILYFVFFKQIADGEISVGGLALREESMMVMVIVRVIKILSQYHVSRNHVMKTRVHGIIEADVLAASNSTILIYYLRMRATQQQFNPIQSNSIQLDTKSSTSKRNETDVKERARDAQWVALSRWPDGGGDGAWCGPGGRGEQRIEKTEVTRFEGISTDYWMAQQFWSKLLCANELA